MPKNNPPAQRGSKSRRGAEPHDFDLREAKVHFTEQRLKQANMTTERMPSPRRAAAAASASGPTAQAKRPEEILTYPPEERSREQEKGKAVPEPPDTTVDL